MTSVFISWSGDASKELAEELRNWIPSVLQFAKPYFTPNDIEKGAKWSSEISKKLAETQVGVICLTKENISRPWILFEAGALSKDLDRSKVCSILFGMDNAEITGPLTTFQTTLFEKNDFKKMMSTINDVGGDQKLAPSTFDRVFEKWWPDIEQKVQTILSKPRETDPKLDRTDRDILEEVLELTRLSMRRRVSSTRVPDALIFDLLNSVEAYIIILDKIGDDELNRAVGTQLDACEYLAERFSTNEDILDKLNMLRKMQKEAYIPF